MPIAGAGFGASQALEKILAEQMIRAQQLQREQQAQAQMEMERQRFAETQKQNDMANQRQARIDDANAGDRRARINQLGVRRMLGEALTQGNGPITSQDRRGLAALQVEAGDEPTLLNEPKVERDPIADYEEKAKIDAKYRPKPVATAPEKKPMVVTMPDGSIKDLNHVLPDGAVPYDQVAARSSKPEDQKEAQDTARESARLAKALLTHKGFNGVFGLLGSYVPTMRQDTADAESLLNSLQSMLTMENMGKMKGVLSDSDMKVLRQASTTLTNRMSEGAARAELQRVARVMAKVTGDPDPFPDNTQQQAAPVIDPKVQELIKKYGGGG